MSEQMNTDTQGGAAKPPIQPKDGQPPVKAKADVDRMAEGAKDAPKRRAEGEAPRTDTSFTDGVTEENLRGASAADLMGYITNMQKELTGFAEARNKEHELRVQAEQANTRIQASAVQPRMDAIKQLLLAYKEHLDETIGKESSELAAQPLEGELESVMKNENPLKAVDDLHKRVEGIVMSARAHRAANAEHANALADRAKRMRGASEVNMLNEWRSARNDGAAALSAMGARMASANNAEAAAAVVAAQRNDSAPADIAPPAQQGGGGGGGRSAVSMDPYEMRMEEIDAAYHEGHGIASGIYKHFVGFSDKIAFTMDDVRQNEAELGPEGIQWASANLGNLVNRMHSAY